MINEKRTERKTDRRVPCVCATVIILFILAFVAAILFRYDYIIPKFVDPLLEDLTSSEEATETEVSDTEVSEIEVLNTEDAETEAADDEKADSSLEITSVYNAFAQDGNRVVMVPAMAEEYVNSTSQVIFNNPVAAGGFESIVVSAAPDNNHKEFILSVVGKTDTDEKVAIFNNLHMMFNSGESVKAFLPKNRDDIVSYIVTVCAACFDDTDKENKTQETFRELFLDVK